MEEWHVGISWFFLIVILKVFIQNPFGPDTIIWLNRHNHKSSTHENTRWHSVLPRGRQGWKILLSLKSFQDNGYEWVVWVIFHVLTKEGMGLFHCFTWSFLWFLRCRQQGNNSKQSNWLDLLRFNRPRQCWRRALIDHCSNIFRVLS